MLDDFVFLHPAWWFAAAVLDHANTVGDSRYVFSRFV